MEFNTKFNIKKFVKISAVALAMISAGGIASTVNANTNVHAESVQQKELAEVNESNAKDQKSYEAYEKKQIAYAEPERKAQALSELKDNEGIESDLAHDPVVHGYLNSKGYTNHQISNAIETPTKDLEGEAMSAITSDSPVDGYLRDNPTVHKYLRQQGFTNYEINHSGNISPDKIAKVMSNNKSASDSKTTVKHHVAKRTRLSKAMVRKIMRQIRLDKKAIRHDNHYLSTRNGKKFTKLMNRSKRAQKRAMHVRGAKRYARYYKDEVKHEKDLVRLTKSTHASKATKRNARRSLKKVRKSIHKNQKNAKRANKHHKARK